MKVYRPKPPVLIARTLLFLFQGRIHYDKDIIGTIVHEDDDYEIFRKIILDARKEDTRKPKAVFRVTFNFARMSISANKKLSFIPTPLIIGQPGFRSKMWMIGKKTKRFQGFYEWDTMASAENYWHSFPMQLMKYRAAPGSLRHEIYSI